MVQRCVGGLNVSRFHTKVLTTTPVGGDNFWNIPRNCKVIWQACSNKTELSFWKEILFFFVLEELSLAYKVNCIYFSLTSKTSLCNGSAFANSSTSTYIHAKEFVIWQNVSAIFGWYLISSSEWANFLNKEQKKTLINNVSNKSLLSYEAYFNFNFSNESS